MNPVLLNDIYLIFGILAPLATFFYWFHKGLEKKFHKIDEKFEKIDARFENIEIKIAGLRLEFKDDLHNLEMRLENKMNQMEIRLSNQMNGRFAKLEERERDLTERTIYLEYKKEEPIVQTPYKRRGRPPKQL